MEERKEMPFGKKFRVGNYYCVKTIRSLSKKEMNELRDQSGIPVDVRKHLNRGGLPYMTVATIGGGWSVSFVCGSVMYMFIEAELLKGGDGLNALHNLFTMMYADTTIMGDEAYWKAKSVALKGLMERKGESAVEAADTAADDEVLKEVEAEHKAKAHIVEMASEIGEEGGQDD